MNVHFIRATARMALLGTALSGLAACASAQQPEAARPAVQQVEDTQAASTPVTPPPPAPAARPASTVAELQSLIQNRQVSELRTTYNGTYGASLLFKPDDLTYYVALFQQKDFWRVVKTQSDKQAEATYRAFAGQSMELAEVDIQRIRLQAEYAHNEKLLASRNAQLSTLQADKHAAHAAGRAGRRPPATIAPGSHRPGRPAEGRAPATARSAAPDRRPAGPAGPARRRGRVVQAAGKRSSVRPACDMAGPSGPAFLYSAG